ncbi:MAG: amino acid racemase [Bacteroidota bacterium]
MNEKLIIIGGGVGPMAGVDLHKKIIENTKTRGKDQDHLQVWHLSRSFDVPDRTEFLNGEIKTNPAEGMARTFLLADEVLKIEKRFAVGGVTCNTFHSPQIFNLFLDTLTKASEKIKILNMIEETGKYIQNNYSGLKKIGLMSTTGTRKTFVYQQILEPFGFEIVQVHEKEQDSLHDSIYNQNWGIKAVSPVTQNARERFLNYSDELSRKGVGAIILGCTEIPLALPEKEINGIPLIDPVYVLARELIRKANPGKLKPL